MFFRHRLADYDVVVTTYGLVSKEIPVPKEETQKPSECSDEAVSKEMWHFNHSIWLNNLTINQGQFFFSPAKNLLLFSSNASDLDSCDSGRSPQHQKP